jgi:hypothetical protein
MLKKKKKNGTGLNCKRLWTNYVNGRSLGMSFNTDICKSSKLVPGTNNPIFNHYMNGVKLGTTEFEHCRKVVNKAKAVLKQITKNFHYRDGNTFLQTLLTIC